MAAFSLFHSHLDLAHGYWKKLLRPGDRVIDATAGNGHDALFLASLVRCRTIEGNLLVIDVQASALNATKAHLAAHLEREDLPTVRFALQCHSSFPSDIAEGSVRLVVYNLGYLPGGDKRLTTLTSTTLLSLKAALRLLEPGGAISLTCYSGHAEGLSEENALLEFVARLPSHEWSCCFHRWLNRLKAPSLLLIQKTGCLNYGITS